MRYLSLFIITLVVASFASAIPVVKPTEQSDTSGARVNRLVESAATNTGSSLVGANDTIGSQYEVVGDPLSTPLTSTATILIEQILKSNNQADINLISQLINSVVLKYNFDYSAAVSGTRSSVADSPSSATSSSVASDFSSAADIAAAIAFAFASALDATSASICATTTCVISLARATIALIEQIAKSTRKVDRDFINLLIRGVIQRKISFSSSSTFSAAALSRPTSAFVEEILKSSKQLNINGINQLIHDAMPTISDQVKNSSVL